MHKFEQFCALSAEDKAKGTSKKVYRSERGVPMWYCGFEPGEMREAFRVPTGMKDIGAWPSDDFRESWLQCTEYLQNLCDKCLSIVLEKPIIRPEGKDDDKSVSYAVFYPNNRGGQQADGINIKQHVDPSLFVMEPVVREPGLEVFHNPTQEWIQVQLLPSIQANICPSKTWCCATLIFNVHFSKFLPLCLCSVCFVIWLKRWRQPVGLARRSSCLEEQR